MTYLSIFSFRNKGTEHQHKSWCGNSELTLGIHNTNESRGMNSGVSLPEEAMRLRNKGPALRNQMREAGPYFIDDMEIDYLWSNLHSSSGMTFVRCLTL